VGQWQSSGRPVAGLGLYTLDFKNPHKKKSHGFKSGDLAGQSLPLRGFLDTCKLGVKIPHVAQCHMARSSILGPDQPVQATSIPLPELWSNMVLQESVVGPTIHGLVLVELQAKSPTPSDATEDHQLMGEGGLVHSEMLWPATINWICCPVRCIAPDILAIDMV
jgi:hypothetical protein